MIEAYLTQLRDKTCTIEMFRSTTKQLSSLLLAKAAEEITLESKEVQGPFGSVSGKKPKERVVLVPILRAGLSILYPALELFPHAPVGMIGIRRNEDTAKPYLYYENLPPLTSKSLVFLLDPMLATGGSATLSINKLLERGAQESQIILISIVASEEGKRVIETNFPKVKQILGGVDPELNQQKFIVPGLGDFGDRFFGTENYLS